MQRTHKVQKVLQKSGKRRETVRRPNKRMRIHKFELEKVVRNDSPLTLTITLRAAATKKMRLRVVGYYQGEYLYSMTNLGLLLSYKDYGIVLRNEMVALAA